MLPGRRSRLGGWGALPGGHGPLLAAAGRGARPAASTGRKPAAAAPLPAGGARRACAATRSTAGGRAAAGSGGRELCKWQAERSSRVAPHKRAGGDGPWAGASAGMGCTASATLAGDVPLAQGQAFCGHKQASCCITSELQNWRPDPGAVRQRRAQKAPATSMDTTLWVGWAPCRPAMQFQDLSDRPMDAEARNATPLQACGPPLQPHLLYHVPPPKDFLLLQLFACQQLWRRCHCRALALYQPQARSLRLPRARRRRRHRKARPRQRLCYHARRACVQRGLARQHT